MKMITFVLTLLLVLPFVAAQMEKVYVIDLTYDKGEVTLRNILVTQAFYQQAPEPEDGYLLELVSFNNEVLYRQRFVFPLEIAAGPRPEWFDEKGNQIYFPTEEESGHLVLEKAEVQLIIPYFSGGKTIRIFDPADAKILDIDVGFFAQLCGDGVCQEHESYLECAQDCPSGSADDFCDRIVDGTCDPDCGVDGDADCGKRLPWIFVGIGFFILILASIVFFLWRKHRLSVAERGRVP